MKPKTCKTKSTIIMRNTFSIKRALMAVVFIFSITTAFSQLNNHTDSTLTKNEKENKINRIRFGEHH